MKLYLIVGEDIEERDRPALPTDDGIPSPYELHHIGVWVGMTSAPCYYAIDWEENE